MALRILPGGERAIVEPSKLRDYCLNRAHPRGRHKARVFASVFGITENDAEELRQALLYGARWGNTVRGRSDSYGTRYLTDFEWSRMGMRGTIRSSWIILAGDSVPRLTTCYVLLN